jgi:RNA polymerase sigma factor (sigma-70 family)
VSVSDSGIKGDRGFPATASSIFRNLKDPGSPEYQRNLQRLVELYWKPVYCVIRHAGTAGNQDAKDLTQDFFASHVIGGRLIAAFEPDRGSFRALLRSAVINFLRMNAREASRQKRGGDAVVLALDGDIDDDTERLIAEGRGLSPEQLFDAAWNHVVVTRAMELLRARLVTEGKEVCFEVLKRYDLERGREQSSYADVGRDLGLSPDQVRHGLAQARAALREIVTEIARDYVDGVDDLAKELRRLFWG